MARHTKRSSRRRHSKTAKKGGSWMGQMDPQSSMSSSVKQATEGVESGLKSLGNSLSSGWNQLSSKVNELVSGKKQSYSSAPSGSMFGGRKSRRSKRSRKTRKHTRKH